jgi:hypothetical protein
MAALFKKKRHSPISTAKKSSMKFLIFLSSTVLIHSIKIPLIDSWVLFRANLYAKVIFSVINNNLDKSGWPTIFVLTGH